MSDMATMPILELIGGLREKAKEAIDNGGVINGMVFNVLAMRLEKQFDENTELRGLVPQAIGWTWADACAKTSEGVDITKHEIPDLIVRIQEDIPEMAQVFRNDN